MINELKTKLHAAMSAQAASAKAFSRASLAAEDGSGTAAELARITNERSASERRVVELRAAITTAEADAAQKDRTTQEAVAKANKEALDAALVAMRGVAAEWDAAVDSLAAITQRLQDAEEKIPAEKRQFHSLQRAQAHALLAIEWKLRAWTGMRVPFFNDNLARLVNHLPSTE
jgi:hypothetical protein